MDNALFVAVSTILVHFASSQEQQVAPVRYAVEGKGVELPCAPPNTAELLIWKFHKNRTNFDVDAAQVYVGNMPSIYPPFNSPSDRSNLTNGNFIIHKIYHTEEGEYWCEITGRNVPTTKSPKYPIHVYVSPKDPKLTPLANSTLTENKATSVARCASEGGKPASKLTWMNGSEPIPGLPDTVVKINGFKSHLNDSDRDLVIKSPTRYDHNRTFSCIIEHPSYKTPKTLNYTVLVMHHPYNIRVWANLTSKMVYCDAQGYPKPTYHWTMPGDLTGFTGPDLFVPDINSLPGGGRFECTADNGFPPNITIRVLVDDLLYPNGKPGLAGLAWWIWGVIAGAVPVIIIIVVVVCCIKCRKTKKSPAPVKYKSALKKPIVKTTEHPTSLPLNREYRETREDSFDSRTPSPLPVHKQALLAGGYQDQPQDVTLVPNDHLRRSREHLYDSNRRASREQLEEVANHISTMTRSWDQLSKSQVALNDTQDELQHMKSNLNKSREQLYHSREALNREEQNYPYIDEDVRQPNYYGQDRQRQPPPAYDYDSYRHDNRGYGNYSDGPQYDDRYTASQEYGDSENYNGYAQDSSYRRDDYPQESYQQNSYDRDGYHYDGYNGSGGGGYYDNDPQRRIV